MDIVEASAGEKAVFGSLHLGLIADPQELFSIKKQEECILRPLYLP